MKKLFFSLMFMGGLLFSNPCIYANENASVSAAEVALQSENRQRKVTFRTDQFLKARDGREIYLYRNGICRLMDGDIVEVECTYTLSNGEVWLLDEYGNSICKARYILRQDRMTVSSLTINGTTFYQK